MRKYSDKEILEFVDEFMNGSDNPDLAGYREQTRQRDFADRSRYLWTMKQVAELGEYRGKRILDVGCGGGWQAFTMSLFDASNEVVGLDILPAIVQGMGDCVEHMRKMGVSFQLTAIQGDICKLDLPESSFDGIYSMEAIEHVHDMKKMLENCFRLLKPSGTIILLNDCNMLHPGTRDYVTKMWNDREHSWKWAEYLRSIRPIEHKDAKPFAVVREEIVKAANPELKAEDVEAIVKATAGLLKPEIERIAVGYQAGIPLPVRPTYDWCRDPITGEYAERLFDPYALADMMREAGFKTTVRHVFRRKPLDLFNSGQFRPLNNLLFKLKQEFILFGRKD